MAAPTFVQEAETSWTSASTGNQAKSTGAFDTLISDVLVALAGSETDAINIDSVSGGGLTWTARGAEDNADYCDGKGFSAVQDANESVTGTVNKTGASSGSFGANFLTFRDSDGLGAHATDNVASEAPSLGITTTQDNSAVGVIFLDWNALDGASRAWRSVNGSAPVELTYYRDSSAYTLYVAYYADVGTAGAKTVGLSTPSGQKSTQIAVEVLGSAGGGSDPVRLLGTLGVGA